MNHGAKVGIQGRIAGPFLKWAGGKNSLLSQFTPLLPPVGSYKRYFEPFLGGGAVFFSLQPEHAYLTDLNHELIEVYRIVRDDVERLIEALHRHYNDHDYFYRVRAWSPADLSPVERAARFIFLNRTCYNGLYRVNRAGQFNVPFGRYANPTICDEPTLRTASAALQNAHLAELDFERATEHAQQGDLIYFDPPYHPLSLTSSFTSYTSSGFAAAEQMRLAELFCALDKRGCYLMLSNSTAPLIRRLYDGFHVHEVDARRAINSNGDGRGVIKEYLITNFDAQAL